MIVLGVLCLGGFVGYLVGYTWVKDKKPTPKTVGATIAAALSGAPLAFLDGIGDERWFYPVGLVVGFIWSWLSQALAILSSKTSETNPNARTVSALSVAVMSVVTIWIVWYGVRENKTPSSVYQVAMTRSEMPCRLAWVYLGKFINSAGQYVAAASFRYAVPAVLRQPVPRTGDEIVMTADRNLLVPGFN